jgi:hypothetical protein
VQEPQFSPFEADTLTPAERQALKQVRGRRLRALFFCLGAGALALFAAGCPEPGDLQDAGAYPAPPKAGSSSTTAGSGTGGSGGSAAVTCEVECVNKLFQKEQTPCLFCHSKATHLGDLDLESPDYTSRLKNQPAKHTGFTGPTTDCPTGDKLIDTTTPANSWLLKKIHNEQKTCGTVMPQSGALTADQKTCLETYVTCVAGGSAPAGTAGTASSGGAATGGSGGTGGA